jgi:hypothetical protein
VSLIETISMPCRRPNHAALQTLAILRLSQPCSSAERTGLIRYVLRLPQPCSSAERTGLIRYVLPTPPGHIPSDADSGDDMARRPLPAPAMKATLPASLGINFSFPIANSKTAGGRRFVVERQL